MILQYQKQDFCPNKIRKCVAIQYTKFRRPHDPHSTPLSPLTLFIRLSTFLYLYGVTRYTICLILHTYSSLCRS